MKILLLFYTTNTNTFQGFVSNYTYSSHNNLFKLYATSITLKLFCYVIIPVEKLLKVVIAGLTKIYRYIKTIQLISKLNRINKLLVESLSHVIEQKIERILHIFICLAVKK